MISLLLASLALSVPAPLQCGDTPPEAATDTLRTTYQSGSTFDAFLSAASARRDQWHANHALAQTIDATLVARAAAVEGSWKLLVVAVDTCSDSVNTVPWIARLADLVDNLELRIVTPDQGGRQLMEAYRTPDGRAATPTVLLLDDQWQVRGCFIERPPALRAHIDSLPSGARTAARMEWYRNDAGGETVTEIVSMLETAVAGGVQCR